MSTASTSSAPRRVALFATCLVDQFFPEVGLATKSEVWTLVPRGQGGPLAGFVQLAKPLMAPLIAQVRSVVAQAKKNASTIGDEDLRKTEQKAVATLEAAVERWADGLAKEVLAGTRTPQR